MKYTNSQNYRKKYHFSIDKPQIKVYTYIKEREAGESDAGEYDAGKYKTNGYG